MIRIFLQYTSICILLLLFFQGLQDVWDFCRQILQTTDATLSWKDKKQHYQIFNFWKSNIQAAIFQCAFKIKKFNSNLQTSTFNTKALCIYIHSKALEKKCHLQRLWPQARKRVYFPKSVYGDIFLRLCLLWCFQWVSLLFFLGKT